MIADYLSSFYSMPINLVVGGQPTVATLRWYKAPAGAKILPFPSAIFSHVWDNNPGESQPGEIGEVGFPRTWDPGRNPGYQGQCYRGDPSWFRTGNLPALPLPKSSCLCQIPPAIAVGGIMVGGSAPAFRGLTTCAACPSGSPPAYLFTVAGGTGRYAQANGQWRIPYFTLCTWQGGTPDPPGPFFVVQAVSSVPPWTLSVQSGGDGSDFAPIGAFQCLGHTQWAFVTGGTGHPTAVATDPTA